jgi:integrase
MASIQKMDNGTWRYRVSYKEGENYKTKTKGGFRTKKEAQLAASELENKFSKGHDVNAADQLFSDYMRNWFEVYKKGKHSPEHERNIERSVRLVEEYFSGVRVKDLTKDMYQRFLNDFGKDHATATVQKRHVYIRSCLRDAIQDGVISKDPTYKAIVKGQVQAKSDELKYLNFDEVHRLVEEIKRDLNTRYISRYIILFAIATGARFSEIGGMTWDCVDFENKTITINKTWDFKDTKDFSDTKTYESKRTITIDKETLDLLRELKIKQKEHMLQTGLRNTKNLVFLNTKMELVGHNGTNKTLRMLCEKIGIKVVTSHSLRHTHASMLLYKGVNIKYLSRRLGHKDITTTLQTYSHIIDEMEQLGSRQVDETMQELFRAKSVQN